MTELEKLRKSEDDAEQERAAASKTLKCAETDLASAQRQQAATLQPLLAAFAESGSARDAAALDTAERTTRRQVARATDLHRQAEAAAAAARDRAERARLDRLGFEISHAGQLLATAALAEKFAEIKIEHIRQRLELRKVWAALHQKQREYNELHLAHGDSGAFPSRMREGDFEPELQRAINTKVATAFADQVPLGTRFSQLPAALNDILTSELSGFDWHGVIKRANKSQAA